MKRIVKTHGENLKAAQTKSGKVHLIKWKTNFGYESACGNLNTSDISTLGKDELEDFRDICKSCQATTFWREEINETE